MGYVRFSEEFDNIISRNMDVSNVMLSLTKYHNRTSDFADYIDIEGEFVSYLPKGRDAHILDHECWTSKLRQKGRPAKVIQKLMLPEARMKLTAPDWELFSTILKAEQHRHEGTFSVVSGDLIRHWYHIKQYEDITSSLTNSCMADDECQAYFDIYTENPKQVEMVIRVNPNGKLNGRALLWQTHKGTFMDRIYGTETVVCLFQEYAREHGWMYRAYNSFEDKSEVMAPVPSGEYEKRSMLLKVSLDKYDHEEYPYLDTFTYLNTDFATVRNIPQHSPNEILLEDTDGGPLNSASRCYDCDRRIVRDDLSYEVDCETICNRCFQNSYRYCDMCGDPEHNEEMVDGPEGYDEICNECFENRCVECDSCAVAVEERDSHRVEYNTYCEACYERDFATCDSCNIELRLEYLDDGLCEECFEEAAKESEETDSDE